MNFCHANHNERDGMIKLPVALAVLILTAILAACSEEKTDTIADIGDPGDFPTMTTVDVSTFISDSGYTRYHITAPVWYMYEEASDPHWDFPDGLHLEKFDNHMKVTATFDADTAIYYSARKMWKFSGLVNTRNTDGDKFLSTLLWWDQNHRKVYTDSFIHVERSDRIIEGYGFESNEEMTDYVVRRPQMILPVSDFRSKRNKNDDQSTDGPLDEDDIPAE